VPLVACKIRDFVQGAVNILGEQVPARLVGDCIAVVGALGGVLSLVASKRMRTHMVLSVYTLVMTATTVPVFLACSFLLDSPSPELNTSPVDGVPQPV
jgi:drug/metabolite transporter (DMT)-like permease